MLEARNIKKQFVSGSGALVVFERLDLTVRAGEFIVITGRSGSGKSTLLYLLGLLDAPDEGVITVDGLVTSTLSTNARTDLRLDRFGYVFQDYGLMSEMTALENVMLPLIMRGESLSHARTLATAALARVGLEAVVARRPAKLSGGQQQRVSIARSIAHNPAYILADEPTANLDQANALQILEVFGEIHRAGTTIIMVTHEKESLALADRVLDLGQGKLAEVQKSTQSPSPILGGI